MKSIRKIQLISILVFFILSFTLHLTAEKSRTVIKSTSSTKVERTEQVEKKQNSKVKISKQPIPRGKKIPQHLIQRSRQPQPEKVQIKKRPGKRLKKRYVDYHHKPYTKVKIHKHKFHSAISYGYTIQPAFIYHGIWIRVPIHHINGFYFYNGYPYIVYHDYLHRYSSSDPGSYDLVDSYTYEVYATFYGDNLKQSYDRCAELRDRLNNRLGEYRYFCAERFEYDPNYSYGWDPSDYPNWFWY